MNEFINARWEYWGKNLFNPALDLLAALGGLFFAYCIFLLFRVVFRKIRQLWSGPALNLPKGRIGLSTAAPTGSQAIERFIICLRIDPQKTGSKSNDLRSTFWDYLWQPPKGFRNQAGLRDLLDSFYNTVRIFDERYIYHQATPFQHIAILKPGGPGTGEENITGIASQFKQDFQPLVERKLEPSVGVYPCLDDRWYVFFGSKVFVPPQNKLPMGEVFVVKDKQKFSITLGQTGGEGLDAGYYVNQPNLYFSAIDTTGNNTAAFTPATVNHKSGLPVGKLFGIEPATERDRTPTLIQYNIKNEELIARKTKESESIENHMLGEARKHNKSSSAPSRFWSIIQGAKTMHGFTPEPFIIDEIEHRYTAKPSQTPNIEIQIIPNTAYSRLRKERTSLNKSPFFQIHGLLVPNPKIDLIKVISTSILIGEKAKLRAHPLEVESSILHLSRIDYSVRLFDRYKNKYIAKLERSSNFSVGALELVTSEDQIEHFVEVVNKMSFDERDEELSRNFPARGFSLLKRRDDTPVGYIGFQVSSQKSKANWLKIADVVYERTDKEQAMSSVLLDWLDVAVQVEAKGDAVGETDRLGYGAWFQSFTNKLDENGTKAMEWMGATQRFQIENERLYLSEVPFGSAGNEGKKTAVPDGSFLRIGPLIVKYNQNQI